MIRLRFDGPPGPKAPRFIEAEDGQGRSIRVEYLCWKADPESSDWFLTLSEELIQDTRPGLLQSEVLAEGFTTEDAAKCLRKWGQFTIWAKPIDKVRQPVIVLKGGEQTCR